ncbi:MAG TPA: Gfo/Idh/MocA family oxidoreductase [Acidimicrobiales bacterium]|nr:Gfo/Idh/MocA family oxidoreductase [Acidimicrobiales bacterium]
MAPVRVALVGYGMAGRVFHAPFIEAADGIELAAVVTADPGRRRHAQVAHPAAAIVESADLLWPAAAGLGVDLVVVATPNRAHVPVALAALGAGLAVVVDKPLAVTAADGRRVVDEAARRRLLLSVFHNRRWDGDFLTVRRLVAAGALGRVWRFESRYERWRPERRPEAWRERSGPQEGGGLLADLGSHLVDQAVVLFGPPVSVYAEMACRRPGAVVDDDTFVALEHADGTTSHLWASSVTARKGPRFRVLGSAGGYVVEGMDPQEEALLAGALPGSAGWGRSPESRWGTIGAGDDVAPVPTEPGNYGRFYEGIVAALRHGAPPPVAPADALLTLEVIDAARRSAALRQPVALGK